MAATRERRSNAGNKMARLLNEEEEDEFYKTTYGGFDEVEQDHDYMLLYIYIYDINAIINHDRLYKFFLISGKKTKEKMR